MCHPGLLALRTHPYTKHILYGHELAAVLTAAIPLGAIGSHCCHWLGRSTIGCTALAIARLVSPSRRRPTTHTAALRTSKQRWWRLATTASP